MHEHFDAEGNRTGHTIVTREPRVSDDDRDQMLELDRYEKTVLCPCGCGETVEDARDPKRAFQVDSWRCGARRAMDMARRKGEAEAGRGKPNNKPDEGWDDGLYYYVAGSFQIDDPKNGGNGGR